MNNGAIARSIFRELRNLYPDLAHPRRGGCYKPLDGVYILWLRHQNPKKQWGVYVVVDERQARVGLVYDQATRRGGPRSVFPRVLSESDPDLGFYPPPWYWRRIKVRRWVGVLGPILELSDPGAMAALYREVAEYLQRARGYWYLPQPQPTILARRVK
jgi:hypothetical protein